MLFTIPIRLRFLLIAVLLGGGIVAAFTLGFWWAFPLLLVGIVLLVGYFLMGTVASAGQLLQAQQLDAADKQLSLTKFPQYLFKFNRAYFYMMKGTIATQKQQFDEGMNHLEESMRIGLPSDNERAVVILQMMGIYGQKKQIQPMKNLLADVKKLKVTEPMLKEQISSIDKQLAQAGTGFRPGMQGQMPGGKRPRPRMR